MLGGSTPRHSGWRVGNGQRGGVGAVHTAARQRSASATTRPKARSSSTSGPTTSAADLPTEFILVAHAMGPAELLDYAHRRIKGLVLEEGSPTSHVAIIARAFDIPVVGRVEEATRQIELGNIVTTAG